jgi:ParB/RepB/Spo0J family partition protein
MSISASTGLRAIALTDIQLSTTGSQAERRKHFDKAAMAELAGSVKAHGVLVPVIARPANGHFELVAGERRYLAAKQAGVAAINADVRTLTDEQVLEIQLIENLQREGLHELAEAEGYEALQKLGHSAEEIADKVGKSKGYIYSRLKLCGLVKASRTAFYDGKLTASTALLLARIPLESLQTEALKEITKKTYGDEIMSFREAARHIRDHYMTDLGGAGFPTEDLDLVPAAGGCNACPKRTGNQAELFGDVKSGNVCTDPVCFKAKREAFAVREIAKAEEAGGQVITGKKAKEIFPYDGSSPRAGFVSLDYRPYQDPKNRTARQLLGKDYVPILVKKPESGELVKVAPESAIKTALKDAGVKLSSSSSGDRTQSAAEKKAKAERAFRQALFAKVRENYPASLSRSDWNDLAIAMLHEMQQETCKHLFSLWDWKPAKEQYGNGNYRKAAAAYIPQLSGAEMSKLLFDCIFVSELSVSTWSNAKPTKLFAAARRFKVNAEQLRRTLNGAQIPKAKASKKSTKGK